MIYIEDNEKKTVREYCTSTKIEKAIELLLQMDERLGFSETHPGYEVTYKKIEES